MQLVLIYFMLTLFIYIAIFILVKACSYLRGAPLEGELDVLVALNISWFVCCHHSPKRGRLKEHLLVLVI